MQTTVGSTKFKENLPVLVMAATAVILQFLTNTRYGFFRDEFYYIACGRHLAFGYVDHPPLIAFISRLVQTAFGNSLFALRLLPAITNGALVILAAAIAKELRGKMFAQSLAAFSVLMAPAFLGSCGILTMNCFEILLWTIAIWLTVKMLGDNKPQLCTPIGVDFGVGLQNKHSMLFLGFGLLVGLLLTPHRKHLLDRHLWFGIAIATIIISPNLVWEMRNHWPTIEFMRNASALKNYPVSPPQFLFGQIMQMAPFSLLVWGTGLAWLICASRARDYRYLGWLYVAIFVLFVFLKAKSYYLAPAYPMLFAAGAVAIEHHSDTQRRHWLRPAVFAVIACNFIALPMVLPVFPPGLMSRYVAALGVNLKDERGRTGRLPQFYADRFGWDNMVRTIAGVYKGLPAADQSKCAVFADNYGEAGAVDFLGGRYGLPQSICGHNSYYLWGPRGYNGDVVIVIGGSLAENLLSFEQVELAATVSSEYSMPYESNLPIYICRKPRRPLNELWARTKTYI